MTNQNAFFACWLTGAIVLGLGLYYVWDALEKRYTRKTRGSRKTENGGGSSSLEINQ